MMFRLLENAFASQVIKCRQFYSCPSTQKSLRGSYYNPLTSEVKLPFLLMSPLNVLFLKEVTKNVHENQQAKSRAS